MRQTEKRETVFLLHAKLCLAKLKFVSKIDPRLDVFVAGLSGDNFRFDRQGDGPARYNIIHFKQVSPGVFRWVRVGEYWEGELRLNMSGEQTKTRCLNPCGSAHNLFDANAPNMKCVCVCSLRHCSVLEECVAVADTDTVARVICMCAINYGPLRARDWHDY